MKNIDVRKRIEDSGIKHWLLAEKLGIHETTFSRRLRKELSNEEKQRIYDLIDKTT